MHTSRRWKVKQPCPWLTRRTIWRCHISDSLCTKGCTSICLSNGRKKLWLGSSPTDPQTPKHSKTRRSDSKVTFGVPVKVTQKLLRSDKNGRKVTFESLLSHFWVGTPKITFESLFRVFECFGVWGSVGLLPGHKEKAISQSLWHNAAHKGRSGTPFIDLLVLLSDSVKRHLSVLNSKFDFISDGGCTREEQIALSLKRHLFPHGGREPKASWICFSRVHPPSEIKSNFKFKTHSNSVLTKWGFLWDCLSSNFWVYLSSRFRFREKIGA